VSSEAIGQGACAAAIMLYSHSSNLDPFIIQSAGPQVQGGGGRGGARTAGSSSLPALSESTNLSASPPTRLPARQFGQC
jgi:hypothetical protein